MIINFTGLVGELGCPTVTGNVVTPVSSPFPTNLKAFLQSQDSAAKKSSLVPHQSPDSGLAFSTVPLKVLNEPCTVPVLSLRYVRSPQDA